MIWLALDADRTQHYENNIRTNMSRRLLEEFVSRLGTTAEAGYNQGL